MPEHRRKFSPQFKAEAVQMVISTGKPIAEVARDLGIHDGTLGNWVNGGLIRGPFAGPVASPSSASGTSTSRRSLPGAGCASWLARPGSWCIRTQQPRRLAGRVPVASSGVSVSLTWPGSIGESSPTRSGRRDARARRGG